MREYIDWAVRGLVAGLISAAIAAVVWSQDMEKRVDATERYEIRITKLESRDESYTQLRSEIAVLKSQMDAQNKTLDRLVALLDRR